MEVELDDIHRSEWEIGSGIVSDIGSKQEVGSGIVGAVVTWQYLY